MFTAVFQAHYVYLAACALIAFVFGGLAWFLSLRFGKLHGVWWGLLVATVIGILGVTFMGGGPASGQCVINHNVAEPFHTTQGLWNLAMTVPLGLFGLLAVRRPLPVVVGVVTLPLAIEFTQATVGGLGRVCDSSDAEMNIVGGLVGLTAALVTMAGRRSVEWQGGLKASLIAAAALLLIGTGVARPMLAYSNIDGTGLSVAKDSQRQAVERAVQEAFGDRYALGHVYEQPCIGVPCTNIIFTLLSRDEKHPQDFANGSLSWPDKKHLNVLLEDSDRSYVMGYPVAGTRKPTNRQDAFQIAQSYIRERYPWAKDAPVHRTFPVGQKAELGWMTNWRWLEGNVLMPRMLDVQVDRAGQVSQVDVTLGSTHVKLEKAKLDARQAERDVQEAMAARSKASGSGDQGDLSFKAFTLKAVNRDGVWRPEWLVGVSSAANPSSTDPTASSEADIWRVDAVSGQVYDGTGISVKTG
ncbi:VanZ family protein [Streptomyces sp. TG1A-8]|uniref:VanZ family protein n=1 Tax=Streptomyces sp. TG1A-8 TaxID=3051385 RepID=UPI00265C1BAA|nr:VanZ family protein [Streptomyces sp. TG1A-8]MDO0929905.1 VanZ family protein [Streptomyces sp. TG1A-8]